MLAPSTVIAIGACRYDTPSRFDGPAMMPLPPRMSMPWFTARRPASVSCTLRIALATLGRSPLSSAAAVKRRAASLA